MSLAIPPFTNARVLVVGDLMLDRYWQGATARISPEAPVPVVQVNNLDAKPGGAGNVAINIASLGASVDVDGVVGDDDNARLLTELLTQSGITCRYQAVAGAATIAKLRVLSRHQQLIRLDFERPFAPEASSSLVARFTDDVNPARVVVLSDYAKGTLHQAGDLIRAARAAGRAVLVDPKGPDWQRYRGATLLTPNLAELEGVVGACPDEATLISKGEALRQELDLEALVVTRGEAGISLLQADQAPLHMPAQAREVFDVTGAGDTVIALIAAGLGAGVSLAEATALANLGAGIVVGKLGAASVTVAELRTALRAVTPADLPAPGVLEEAQLRAAVAQARAWGERIVMTNGCFDLLHAGHVSYLEAARRCGDRLIVAVNDDASVARLKGAERPVTPLSQRMAVLAGLRSVDWVVPFSEDTPERLICRVAPDILVKGGDYAPQAVAGYDCVTAAGGEVVVLEYLPDCSTSGIIALLQKR